jgi:hypothetical protein
MASTSANGLSNGQVSDLQQSGEFSIKSESVTPKLGRSISKIMETWTGHKLTCRHLAMAFAIEELRQASRSIVPLHPYPHWCQSLEA